MKLSELLVITELGQPYEIFFNGTLVISETSDLERFSQSNGEPNDLVEKNLDSEIKKVYTRPFSWRKPNKGRAQLVIDMKNWRTE